MITCKCPANAALTTIPAQGCAQSFGQIQKVAFQRLQTSAGEKNSFTIEDMPILANWTDLMAAADGTKIVGQYSKGDIVKVTLQYKVGNTIWCKTEKGWVSSMYMELTSVEDEPVETKPGETAPENDEKITAVGVIVGADKVRIRNLPGVNGTKIVGYYERGELITITLQQKVGNNIWGKMLARKRKLPAHTFSEYLAKL